MLLRRAARRLRPQTRGLSAMPTSFADYAEADETMQDYAGNVRRDILRSCCRDVGRPKPIPIGGMVKIEEHLAKDGILVRQLHSYNLPNCLRITIGTQEEMQSTLNSLKKLI